MTRALRTARADAGAQGLAALQDAVRAGVDPVLQEQGRVLGFGAGLRAEPRAAQGGRGLHARPHAFGRTDCRIAVDAATGHLSGSVEGRFTRDAHVEAADPVGQPGPLVDTVHVDGQRLAAGLSAQ